jgi:tetratricopeptide (TPR) repeat protein
MKHALVREARATHETRKADAAFPAPASKFGSQPGPFILGIYLFLFTADVAVAIPGLQPHAPLTKANAASPTNDNDDLESLNDRIAARPTETDLLKRARIYLLDKDTKSALADLQKALALNPQSEVALSLRAQILASVPDLPGAKQDLERLVQAQPSNEHYWLRLSDVCDQMSDQEAAVKAIDQAIKLKPEQAKLYGQKAAIFARQKDSPGTISALNAGLEKIPGNELLLFFRAVANEKMNGNDTAALKDLEEVLSTHPDFLKAYGEHAQIKLKQNQLSAAKKDYDALIERIDEQERRSKQEAIDKSQSAKSVPPGAPATENQAATLVKERTQALDARARVERSMRDFEHACADALAAHSHAPKDVPILADLANMYFADERLLMAKTYFEELLKRAPKHRAQTKFALAYICLAEGDYASARNEFTESIKDGADKTANAYIQVYLDLLKFLAPEQTTADVAGSPPKQLEGKDWPLPFASYLHGQLPLQDLEKMATTNGQKTELHALLGLEAMAKKDSQKAKKEFEWVDENGEPDYLEYAMSRNILGKLQ